MKKMLKVLQKAMLVCGLTLCLSGLAVTAEAQSAKVFSPDANVFGMSYGDWSAAWWQYVLSIPVGENPVLDETGDFCGIGQSHGPVFFLAGYASDEPVTRNCTVPAGKALVVPILNVECSTVEDPPFFGENGQELRTCVAEFVDGVGINTLNVVIDNKKIQDLRPFRIQSAMFDFNMPEDDNFLGLPGITSGSSVSDGYWVIIEPLAPGTHVIQFGGAFVSGPGEGFSQNITYNLTVE